jgi:hypothetical protein
MENAYRDAIRKLVGEHYEQNISVGEYRTRRRQLIDQMDNEFNGSKPLFLVEDVKIDPQSK